MLNSNLSDYGAAYIFIKGTISVPTAAGAITDNITKK